MLLLAGVAAGVTYLVQGPPEREIACDPEAMEPGYICYSQLEELGDFLWVDARKRAQWERDGMPGSVLLTDDPAEDWEALFAEAASSIVMADAVVVYCDTEACGSSEPVARKIKETGIMMNPLNVFILYGGARALPPRDSSQRN
ncbi:MAG: rhodanese-like domain-containing protein [Verrucomicrobiota bacterium JB023]|nr:rhodanese-like domain-containing protein [Verrucomicrobiota bacterium JB023]